MSDRAAKVREIFDHAAEISSAPERQTYLDTACAGDADLRSQVDALLQAYNDAGSFLDHPAVAVAESSGGGQTEAFDKTPPERTGTSATHVESNLRPDDSLPYLASSTKPGSIGRIAHYEVLQVVGQGGFGTVLKAFDEKLHRVAAIKVLSPAYAANGAARKRFIREAQTAAAVKNEHVVAIYSVQDEADPPYLVMELIDGISLQDKLDKKGPLSVKEILRIGMQMAEGLAAAHKQGLVHRDIKPANILLENGVERVKITDFGLARAVDDASVTQSGTVAGTPMYMSPEQAEGAAIDHRSDLFSLGTVLYAMCTGHPPFRASGTHAVLKRVIDAAPRPIREINNEVPDWLCDIIAKLHAKKPEDRFQTAREVAEMLGQRLADVQAGRAIERAGSVSDGPATPAEPVADASGSSRIRRVGMALAAIAILAALTLASPYLYRFAMNQCTLIFSGTMDPNLDKILVKQQGETVAELTTLEAMVHIPAGDYQIEVVSKAGYELSKYRVGGTFSGATDWQIAKGPNFPIRLARADHVSINVELEKLPNSFPSEPGFMPLFNGKDLTGWKTHPTQPGNWRVDGNHLVSSGATGYLFSEKGDWQDFHLRAEVHIVQGGNSGIFFRTPFELRSIGKPGENLHVPKGWYEADIFWGPVAKPGRIKDLAEAKDTLAQPNQWMALEIIAQGNRLITRVNGKDAVDVIDSKSSFKTGHIALQAFSATTSVRFKKIEIKELPPADKDDRERLNGTWVAVDFETVGKNMKDRLKQIEETITFTGERARVKSVLRDSEKPSVNIDLQGILVLEPGANPKRFRIVTATAPDKLSQVVGIYEFQDDTLRLCYQIHDIAPATPTYPTEFATKAGTPFLLMTLKRRADEEPGWVQLFNRKDLTNWKPHPNWRVENNLLVASGPVNPTSKNANLHSERADFGDFHLRAEARMLGEDHDSGVFVRVDWNKAPGSHCEANIGFGKGGFDRGSGGHTGSLDLLKPGEGYGPAIKAPYGLAKPNEWFTLEIIVRGQHIMTKVNGVFAAETRNAGIKDKGLIVLQQYGPQTVVHFKKIEIKELPPEEPGWVKLFNGKDLIGWKTHPDKPGQWRVENNLLVGTGPPSHLFSERGDYENFHLRAVAKINKGGNSGILFRSKFGYDFGLQHGKNVIKMPAGFEVELASDSQFPTGSIIRLGPAFASYKAETRPTPQDTWFTLEIIARGKRLITKVDGQQATDVELPDPVQQKGHVALQVHITPGAVVQFKSIEIKELPPEEPGWVKLFNGKNLDAWDASVKDKWTIKDSILHGTGKSWLISKKSYTNFHLRATTRYGIKSQASIVFRTSGSMHGELGMAGTNITLGLYDDGKTTNASRSKNLTKSYEWFNLDLIVRGSKATVMINGVLAAETTIPELPSSGRIHLSAYTPTTSFEFKNVEIKELPSEEPGWVKLFDGKDLTDWKKDPMYPGTWHVENKNLVGQGATSMLYSTRNDYENFHWKVEAKVEKGGIGGLVFRTRYGIKVEKGRLTFAGNQVQITGRAEDSVPTGSILSFGPEALAKKNLVKPGEWFTLELIAQGAHFIVKVNQETVVDFVDRGPRYPKGHLGLLLADTTENESIVRFRKIEIKELPPEEPGWMPLFNGKDLDGWVPLTSVKDQDPKAPWKIADGVLWAKGGNSGSGTLRTVKAYENYTLKLKFRLARRAPGDMQFVTDAGVILHRQEADVILPPTGIGFRLGRLWGEDRLFPVDVYPRDSGVISIQEKYSITPPGEWNDLVLTSKDGAVDAILNGKLVAKFSDCKPGKGFIVLQATGTPIDYRDIEIQEQHRTAPEEPGWAPLFNGKDLTGWKKHPRQPGNWRIEDNLLVGSGPGHPSHLFSERGDYQDFHLRAQVKISIRGDKKVHWADSGIFFRSPFAVDSGGSWPTGYEAQIQAGDKTFGDGPPIRTGSLNDLVNYDKRIPGAEVDEWFTMEVIARGNRITIKVNDVTTVDNFENKSFQRGHLILQQGNEETLVSFKKIEIKELPPAAARLPNAADEVLPALAGAWKGEYTQKIYGGKPDVKKINAAAVNDWIVGQKWLRQRVQIGDEGFQSVTTYEPGTKSFRDFFFHSRGLIFAPSTGRWEPATRTITWSNLPDTKTVLLMTLRFVDADTFSGEIIIRDKEGNTVFEMSSLMKRTSENLSIDDNVSAGPLPKEMAVLDRLVGDWDTSGVIKDAKNPDGYKSAWQSSARKILGGRVIATERYGDDEGYSLTTFDIFSKAYGRWSFRDSSSVLEYHGLWDEKSQTLHWHWSGKDGSQNSNIWPLGDPNRRDWQVIRKDALGKTTYEVQATSVRKTEPGWVQLFNRKDLQGWTDLIPKSNAWKIDKGILEATGQTSGLVSRRNDFGDFHVRMEMMANAETKAKLMLRADASGGKGYELELGIARTQRTPGSIMRDLPVPRGRSAADGLVGPGEWFTLEVIAKGNRFIVLQNGKEALDWTDDRWVEERGRIALIQEDKCGLLKIRKLEVRDLTR